MLIDEKKWKLHLILTFGSTHSGKKKKLILTMNYHILGKKLKVRKKVNNWEKLKYGIWKKNSKYGKNKWIIRKKWNSAFGRNSRFGKNKWTIREIENPAFGKNLKFGQNKWIIWKKYHETFGKNSKYGKEVNHLEKIWNSQELILNILIISS